MLDYSAPQEERCDNVREHLAGLERPPSGRQLTALADYILCTSSAGQTKRERREERPIITPNREKTVFKRQVSYESLVDSPDCGEEALQEMIVHDRNQIMDRRSRITEGDVDEVPGLRSRMAVIESLKAQLEASDDPARRYSLKRQVIEEWQQAYILKSSYRGAVSRSRTATGVCKALCSADLPESPRISHRNLMPFDPVAPITLLNQDHVRFLLCNYSQLRQEVSDDPRMSDMHCLLLDLEDVAQRALRRSPVLWDVLTWKVDGLSNEEIKARMRSERGISHSEQYYSSLWRRAIPKAISAQAMEDYLNYHYVNEGRGAWRTCGRCGRTMLAHPLYFSKNDSKSGYHSICKECRRGDARCR